MLKDYFSEADQNAFKKCHEIKVNTLVGCSVDLDSNADITDSVNPGQKIRKTQNISMNDFYNVFERLLKSTRENRLTMKGMDFVSVDLIVPAVILIDQLIIEIGIEQIIQTDFALREGALRDDAKKFRNTHPKNTQSAWEECTSYIFFSKN